jgi:hypothetical protein
MEFYLELPELPVALCSYRCVSRRLSSRPYLPSWYSIYATAYGGKKKNSDPKGF